MLELRAGHEIDLRQFRVGREKLPALGLDDPISNEKRGTARGGQQHGHAYRRHRILDGEFREKGDRNACHQQAEQPQLLPAA
ncbi:hypothetical protein [Nonomuraea sp. MG754425]|uniref:hypothetical protein n=1 Tax=Nonomuraea sp. MG754425 TaxID=2570319 RepID=UPI001F3AF16C|nr:hypothetical protein [Nonomuraea sp. MG754425]